MESHKLRVATYNVHKCCGLDGRTRPERVLEVLRDINADVFALQEVICIDNLGREANQGRYLAEELGFQLALGENRRYKGGAYGNVVLSRYPLRSFCNYDLSIGTREERGCLRTDVNLSPDHIVHIFNVHLGTAFMERRHQARKLMAGELLASEELTGPRVVLGDFNEWTRGLVTHVLRSHLESADIQLHLKRTRTYPGFMPLIHLDHIYHDPALKLERLTLHKTRASLMASDHLPLVADFRLE